mgnify:CR=1 FL=1
MRVGVSEPLLRDEVYCQLIKQTTKNPNQRSLLLGLKLLWLCASCFPPSPELYPFLLSHLATFAHSQQHVLKSLINSNAVL